MTSLILVLILSVSDLTGQCTTSVSTVIPDPGSTTIQFLVTGLVDNNLSSPTQGICGVEIDFMHEWVGDLTITLISPSGTSVILMGPTTSASSLTNLTRWNIDFVPCSMPAAPDPGFTAMWSNEQSWEAITSYSGTYHPHSGCLENFNTGPANGIWQIVITDHDLFGSGAIASMTLIFCNPAGLQCTECNANAGVLSPSSFSVCSGENLHSAAITVDFGGNVPDPLLYQYEYILLSGNTILQSGSAFSATLPAGDYSICGMSYLRSDTQAINVLLDLADYSTLSQAISGGVVCADLTSSCIQVNISAKPDTLVETGMLCQGEVFSYRGQNYTTAGVFYQVYDGPGLCDTVIEIRISPRTLMVTIEDPDTLACGSGPVTLSSMVTGAMGPYIYEWTTSSGNIISPSNVSQVSVDQAGHYMLSVTDGICNGTGSVHVHADQGFPQIVVQGGTITCTKPVIHLQPIFIPTDGLVHWSGPAGFTSDVPDISVTVPGTYFISVENQNGCSTTKPVEILEDTSTTAFTIMILEKNCRNNTVTLANTDVLLPRVWNWTGPNNFVSDHWRPVVSDAGTYMLTITFANGCMRSAQFIFDGDFSLPDISTNPDDTLHCNDVLTLSVSSLTPGVLFEWNGPQHFYSTQATVQATQTGDYLVTAFAPNGCRNTDTINVVKGDDIFDYERITDTLNCAITSVVIGIVSAEADIYRWINHSGPDTLLPLIEVTVPGVYTVMVTDTHSDCRILVDIVVHSDYRIPQFGFSTDTITCDEQMAELRFIPYPEFTYTSMYWELPDLTVVQGPAVMSSLTGVHRLIAAGENGCLGVRNVHIPFDTLPPFLIVEIPVLGCEDTLFITALSLDSIDVYQWSGPGIISQNFNEAEVNLPGWYHLLASGANGCITEMDIFVDSNFVRPAFILIADSLRCDQPAELRVVTTDAILSYVWYDGSGQPISLDSFVVVTQPGQYIAEVRGLNRCATYDTVSLDPLVHPMISISSDTLTCKKVVAQLHAAIDISPERIEWIDGSGNLLGSTIDLFVDHAGPFILSVTSFDGCEVRDTFLVPVDTLAPMAMIELMGEIRCRKRDVIFDGSGSIPADVLFSWTTEGGLIQGNPAMAMIEARDSGYYFLTVESLENGCIDSDTFHLTEHPDAIASAILQLTPPTCHGATSAAIEVINLQGGIDPLLYQLNSGPVQTDPVFSGLPAGVYLLTIIDAAGCQFDTVVTIAQTGNFIVDAGPDQEINIGESAMLSGTSDLINGVLLTSQWASLVDVLCLDCQMVEVAPLETTTYEFQITTITGCVQSDQMTVYVTEKGQFFIANIFSPNGDNINDEIRVHASSSIERVLNWIIYDRWGNAVFGKTDFDPEDSSIFWNGQTTTGDYASSGVYAYQLEVRLINGKIELYNGSITLVR